MKNEIPNDLEKFIPIVKGIAETFGSNCEVVLHSFQDLQDSIITIENGHVTGRSLGSPMTEVSLKKIREGKTNEDIINYTGKSTDGRVLKSSTMFLKDDDGEVMGCLCINFDMTELVVARKVLSEIMTVADDQTKPESTNKINDVLSDLVQKNIDDAGKPIAYLSKEEKVTIVMNLDKQGAFLIKGAIDYVAKVLCVSRYTIYNYLDEIRI